MHKKTVLFILLCILSITAGAAIGLLDLFGFIDGRHTLSLSFFIISFLSIYAITIVVFLLNFAEKQRNHSFFILAGSFFAMTFFLMNLDILLTLLTSVFYLIFLYYSFEESHKRSRMFVKFLPREIFFPVMKKSFLYIMIVLSLIAFVQSKKLISENSLFSPSFVRILIRPTVMTINKQLGAQLQSQLGDRFKQTIGTQEREKIVRFVLAESIEAMGEGQTRQVFGFRPDTIPIDKTIVYENGDIDVAPVAETMLPSITEKLNQQVQKYALIAPFAIALLAFLIIQTFILPFQLFEGFIALILFKILISSGFIRISKETIEIEKIAL